MNLPRYVGIKDNSTLVRDTFSMGVVNTNQNALNESLKRHRMALEKLADDRRKEQELNTLRKEVDELKVLVGRILEKKEL
jgi:hypothetical protein